MLKDKLISYLETAELIKSPGLYVGVKYTDSSLILIEEWFKENSIDNPVSIDYIHTTVMYSRKFVPYVPGCIPQSYDESTINPSYYKFRLWKTDKGNTLVLSFKNKYLQLVHNHLRKLGCTYDYNTYIPHITLSKNTKTELKDLSPFPKPIVFYAEYAEPLDIN